MESHNTETIRSTTPHLGYRVFAGVGIAALILVIIWVGIRAVNAAPGFGSSVASVFASFRNRITEEEMLVLTPSQDVVVTNEAFTLSWEHVLREDEGSYTFSYACGDDFHFESEASTNNGGVIFCNTPMDFLNDDNALALIPVSTSEAPLEVPFRIHFTPNGQEAVALTGEGVVTVVSSADSPLIAGAATTTTPDTEDASDSESENSVDATDTTVTPTTPATPAPVTPVPGVPTQELVPINTTPPAPINDPNGTPDLVINILGVGIVDENDVFIPQTLIDPDDRAGIKFEVLNVGTKESGTWKFKAELPTEPKYTYRPRTQESILPGGRTEFILGFDDVEDDNESKRAVIIIDSSNQVDELNEDNNEASVVMPVDVS